MQQKKYYPSKRDNNNSSITKPFANVNRTRYKQGHQNQLLNASRRTETYSQYKTVIVTESVNIVDFNSDDFEYEFGDKKVKKKQHNYNNNQRRKY
ncbi:MAG: hypothetical protein JEZ05_00455 [Tenericutes bacterium]|nr:hypothetical protein [Mycoplasmatota bacterium]